MFSDNSLAYLSLHNILQEDCFSSDLEELTGKARAIDKGANSARLRTVR